MRLLIRILGLFWLLVIGLVFFTQLSTWVFSPMPSRGVYSLLMILYLILLIAALGTFFLRNRARKILAGGLALLFVLNLWGTASLVRGGFAFHPDELLIGTLNWFAEFAGIHHAVPLFLPVILLGISAVILFLPKTREVA
jgi:hypothetical protein